VEINIQTSNFYKGNLVTSILNKKRMPPDIFCFSQICKALAGADRKDLMRKLPKFIYDEEKALEVRSCSCIYNP